MNLPQRFNEEFQKELEARPFPSEKLSPKWWDLVIYSMVHASMIGLGINPEDWKALLTAQQTGLTLYQFAILSNNLQARTPSELTVTLEEYQIIMAEADEYVKIWNDRTKEVREAVDTKLHSEQQLSLAGEGKGVEALLKSIKAEA